MKGDNPEKIPAQMVTAKLAMTFFYLQVEEIT
jgi:hypothetical protein